LKLEFKVAIIHLGFPLPKSSSDLPENARLGGQPFFSFSYLVLHREEFTQPRVVTNRAVALLPQHFTHHPKAGLFSVALVVIRFSSNARTLSGSPSYGVRTFLS